MLRWWKASGKVHVTDNGLVHACRASSNGRASAVTRSWEQAGNASRSKIFSCPSVTGPGNFSTGSWEERRSIFLKDRIRPCGRSRSSGASPLNRTWDFHSASLDLSPVRKDVVSPGEEGIPLPDGIMAISPFGLAREIREKSRT